MLLNPLEAFVLGLGASASCLAHCLPVVGPALAADGRGGVRPGLRFLLEFLAGRLVSYAAVGAALGAASALVDTEAARRVAYLLYVPLGALLVLHVLRESGSSHGLCRWLHRHRRWARTPLALGVVVGFAPCPPFALAAASIFGAGGDGALVAEGALFFVFFFAGSSLVFLPLAAVSLAARAGAVRKAGVVAAVLAGCHFLFLGVDRTVHPPAEEAVLLETHRARLEALVPEADSFSDLREARGVPYVEARRAVRRKTASGRGREEETASVEVLGVCVCTSDVSDVRGYGGEVPVLLFVRNDGTLGGLEVVPENRETPAYVTGVYAPSFARSFLDRRAGDALRPGRDVDGVTGATVTVEAVAASVRESLARVSVSVLGLENVPPPEGAGLASLSWGNGAVLLVLFLLAAAGYGFKPAALARAAPAWTWRYAVWAAAFLYLGLYKGLYVTGVDLARAFAGRVPDVAAGGDAWFLLLGLFVLSILFFGKLYCGWLCPAGNLQEILYRLVPVRVVMSERADRRARLARPVLLGLWPLVLVAADNPSVLTVEPLAAAFAGPWNLGALALVLLAAVLVCCAVVERFYCKYVCPVGGLVDLLAPQRIVMPDRRCGGCYLNRPGCRYLAEAGDDFQERADRLRGDCVC